MSSTAQLAAFRRLLADAHLGGQAKVDALLALAQRTLFVVPWPGGVEGYRTLVSSDGVAALPLFTGRDTLEAAARRYGWLSPDGGVPSHELGARAALNYAIEKGLSFAVIDIASEHALELTKDEFAPLLTASGRRDTAGPFAGAGKLSSSLIRAVRPTPPPMAPVKARSTPPPSALAAPRVPSVPTPPPTGVSAPELARPPSTPGFQASPQFNPAPSAQSFGSGSGVTIAPLGSEPSDELIEALTNVLRGYPEVEWACFVSAARGPTRAVPTIGVRVDTGFRQRVGEIVTELRGTSEAAGAALDVLLLDDANVLRAARGEGLVFYPWRK